VLHPDGAVGGLNVKANLLRSKDAFPPVTLDTVIGRADGGSKIFPTFRVYGAEEPTRQKTLSPLDFRYLPAAGPMAAVSKLGKSVSEQKMEGAVVVVQSLIRPLLSLTNALLVAHFASTIVIPLIGIGLLAVK
jgi:hypothetical protein